jgi:hypothetical protein
MVSLEDIRLTLKKIKNWGSTHFMCLRVFVSSQNILISITPLYVKINFWKIFQNIEVFINKQILL